MLAASSCKSEGDGDGTVSRWSARIGGLNGAVASIGGRKETKHVGGVSPRRSRGGLWLNVLECR